MRIILFCQLYPPLINKPSCYLDALLNPSAALQSTAEDFLDSFERAAEPALADIINCIFRSCGCNASVSADEATDSDGVVDTLEALMEDVKKVGCSDRLMTYSPHLTSAINSKLHSHIPSSQRCPCFASSVAPSLNYFIG